MQVDQFRNKGVNMTKENIPIQIFNWGSQDIKEIKWKDAVR